MRPHPDMFRTFNAYCRAMDDWTALQWIELARELKEIA